VKKKHIQLWLEQPLADRIEAFRADHGGIAFTAAVSVLVAKQLRAEGYGPVWEEDHEHDSQDR